MKKLSKESVFSIAVVILFVGSIFGIAVAGGDRTDNIRNSLDNPEIDNNITEIQEEVYVSQITAEVANIYPQFVLIATTEEFDKTIIENKLSEIENITLQGINFNMDGNEFIVINRFQLQDIDKENEVLENIKNIDFFKTTEFYQNATIYLPDDEINLVSDSNKTKNYYFQNGRAEAVVGVETLVEDKLSGQLQVSFKKDTPTSILFLEITNLSSQPQFLFNEINLDVNNFEESYLLKFKGTLDKNITQEDILFYFDENIEVSLNDIKNLSYDLNNQNINDINSYLTKIKDENQSIISEFYLEKTLDITLNEFDSEKYNLLINDLSDLNLKNPTKTPYREVTVIVNENYEFTNIENDLLNLDLTLEEIKQKGIFEFEEINIEDINYTYENNIAEAWLKYPENLEKTNYNLNIQAYVSRNNLLYVQLAEI